MVIDVEVYIRGRCSENPDNIVPEPNRSEYAGVRCLECGATSYRRDKMLTHESIKKWVPLDVFKELLRNCE
jgi:hypothetical protein